MDKRKMKKLLILNLPYFLVGLFATNLGEAWRLAEGADSSAKILSFFHALPIALNNPFPSFHPLDLLIGILCGAGLRLAVYLKGKNAKKYRHNVEYGSARWGTAKDIEPFIAPKFEDNVILTKTERLMMSNRPKNPANARNKNVLIIGGSGSGKTRFWLKPNLLQMHSSYVVTDPKGSIVIECGNALLKHGYTIKIFNTINFQKSMHYNPFAYIHSEKDILKLVTTLIANTKGDGKAGDEFWTKAETLLYCALIGYIHYEAPVEEQNFSTLIEFLNAMEVREDDEEFQNPVDLMFEALEKKKPNHFAVRQYKKYKLAAGKRSVNSYTAEGRAMIHKQLEAVDMEILHYLMRNPVWNATIEYNDNRLSLYSAQMGKCAVTGAKLMIGDIFCHHKVPRCNGGTDAYQNLILVCGNAHRLIHATDTDTITRLTDSLNLTPKQKTKVDKLRSLVHVESC